MIVTILSGSSRTNSSTLRACKGLERVLLERGARKVNVVSFEDFDIPFFNGPDIQPEALTPFQARLVAAMTEADSIIMATPEYNWFPSAELVNLIHRLADKPFLPIWQNKVFSFVGVSTGRGGRMPTVQLGYVVDKIISVLNISAMTNPKSFEIQFIKQVLDAEGQSLGNAEFDRGMELFIDYMLDTTKRWKA
ncbi:MAG: NADPH-dependent oxidoreductase [Bacteroidetes bacterium]|nr:MAG: NADPH-dependent oxidoreductase [Bacteroidota bacterium]